MKIIDIIYLVHLGDEGKERFIYLSHLGWVSEYVLDQLSNRLPNNRSLPLVKSCLETIWTQRLKSSHMINCIKDLTGCELAAKHPFLLLSKRWKSSSNARWLMVTFICKEVTKITGNHLFKLVLVPNPVPIIILKNIISISPSSNRRGTMKIASITITKMQPFSPRFLVPKHLLLEKHLLILTPNISLLCFQNI